MKKFIPKLLTCLIKNKETKSTIINSSSNSFCKHHQDININLLAIDHCYTCNLDLCYICSNSHATKISCIIDCILNRGK